MERIIMNELIVDSLRRIEFFKLGLEGRDDLSIPRMYDIFNKKVLEACSQQEIPKEWEKILERYTKEEVLSSLSSIN